MRNFSLTKGTISHTLRNSFAVIAAIMLEHSFLIDAMAYDVARSTKKFQTYSVKEMEELGYSWEESVITARKLLTKPTHHCRTRACGTVDLLIENEIHLQTLRFFQNILNKAPKNLYLRYFKTEEEYLEKVGTFTRLLNYLSDFM